MKGCCIVGERTVDEKGVNNKLQGGCLLKEKMDSRKKSAGTGNTSVSKTLK